MKKVFLCHATEDKPFVEHIYNKLKTEFSDLDPWLDKYEIVGGNSLIDKIAKGIDNSEKFLVFLSKTSVQKPWVNKELKKAIIREVDSGKDNFIIPILINKIPAIPSFLEDKFYIDIQNYTESELLHAIYNSISDMTPDTAGATVQNLQVKIVKDKDKIEVQFHTNYWAEDVSFEITLNRNFKKVLYGFTKSLNAFSGQYVEEKAANVYRICLPGHKITTDNAFIVHFQMEGKDETKLINVRKWNEGFTKPQSFKMEVRGL